ncbi:VanZ family protein [Mangrovibacterium lignilyticum]|uniref:VanZ family protein n=1 Tax=Mangrovibacterium lignilyticum TaxID=2668052 RepID=UPI0013D6BE9A|nr:VanZ family protein [Mangrovibacterium lignilyticum]
MVENNFIPGIRNYRLGQGFTLFWTFLIFVLCLMPATDLPKAEGIPNLDKIVHFTLYFVLTLSAFTTLKLMKTRINTILILSGFFSLGLLIEILQFILPFNRSFSVYDLIANSIGFISGWIVYRYFIANKIV